jgi:hypothetical protein
VVIGAVVGGVTSAMMQVVAQLTGLKHLTLAGLPRLLVSDPTLLQLTALTGLEVLSLFSRPDVNMERVAYYLPYDLVLQNKVSVLHHNSP